MTELLLRMYLFGMSFCNGSCRPTGWHSVHFSHKSKTVIPIMLLDGWIVFVAFLRGLGTGEESGPACDQGVSLGAHGRGCHPRWHCSP